MQLEPISVDVDAAIPIGLIVTELLTNAFKYAFPGGRRGEVRIGLVSRSGYGELTIMDDGVGLPTERDGSGFRIVQALVTQIEGDLELLTRTGTRWILRFPLVRAVRVMLHNRQEGLDHISCSCGGGCRCRRVDRIYWGRRRRQREGTRRNFDGLRR